MQLASVSLPNLHLVTNEQQLDFSLTGSLQLRFPDGVNTNTLRTSSDLLKLVTEKHLWVARTGCCYFQLEVSIQGEPVSERNNTAKLEQWVRDCEVWSRAGVDLRVQERSGIESLGKMSFSMQHPDLSSALVTPRDAFMAEFESVTCHISLSSKKNGLPVEKRSLKRKRTKQHIEFSEPQQPNDVPTDDEHLEYLSPDDQSAIDAFIQSLSVMPAQQGRGKYIPKLGRNDLTGEKIELSERHRQLFEVALEIIILGSRKQYKGIAAGDYTRAECLTRLAPGVFSMPYLKTISDRASLLPVIATSLARMKTAESPSLRQKAASFSALVTDVKCDYSDRVIRGIEKSTWDVLLSTIKIPTRSRKGGHDDKRVASSTETRQGTGLCEPDISLSTIEREEGERMVVMALSGADDETENRVAKQSLSRKRNPSYLESRQSSLPKIQASDASPLLDPHYCHAEAELNPTINSSGVYNKPLMDEGAYEHQFTTDATMWNYGLWSLDAGSLTFEEWLCPSESATKFLGISYQEYGDVDASFYKS